MNRTVTRVYIIASISIQHLGDLEQRRDEIVEQLEDIGFDEIEIEKEEDE